MLAFDAVKDFSPVAGVAAMPHVLVVRKDFEAKSVGDVVAMAKAKPGALTFGSMGNGSGAHLAAELFKTKAGIDMLHVLYKGLAPMTTELLAGRSTSASPAARADRATDHFGKHPRARHRQRPADATSSTPSRRLPRPALRRRGRRLVGAVCAGKDAVRSDRSVVQAWRPPFNEFVRASLAPQGLPVALKTPAEMSAMLPGEAPKWAAVIKLANVTVE